MKYEIVEDFFANDPREDECIFEFTLHHHKYHLANEIGLRAEAFDSWEDMASYLKPRYAMVVPVYMYEHGNVALSTKPFGCPWDSGRVGFALLSREKLLNEYGRKYITNKLSETLTNVLETEVQAYSAYLNGECYGVQIIDDEGDVVDCDYGYYGYQAALASAEAYMSRYEQLIQN